MRPCISCRPGRASARPGTHRPQRLDRVRRMDPRLRGDDVRNPLPRANSQIQLSNSQFQTALANAPPPVFFTGAPGRPVFASLPSPAEAREWSAVRRNQRVQRLAALTCLCDRHVRHTALHRRLFCPRDRASGRGHLIQAAFAALHPRLVQPLKAAPRSWSGRRPGASRRRGCETTPAGAASGSATKTPLDDALASSRTHRIIVSVGLKSRPQPASSHPSRRRAARGSSG